MFLNYLSWLLVTKYKPMSCFVVSIQIKSNQFFQSAMYIGWNKYTRKKLYLTIFYTKKIIRFKYDDTSLWNRNITIKVEKVFYRVIGYRYCDSILLKLLHIKQRHLQMVFAIFIWCLNSVIVIEFFILFICIKLSSNHFNC